MNRDHQPPVIVVPTSGEQLHSPGKRRLDPIDEPARPLGAKCAALQLRRQREGAVRTSSVPQPDGTAALILRSKDGLVSFAVRASPDGLLIGRTQRGANGARLLQFMFFADAGTFDRWCESDPMRFDDAVLYDQLRREGHAALCGKP